MSSWDGGLLAAPQREFVEAALGAPRLVDDFSWGLIDTRVLHIEAGGQRFIAKAASPGNHHIHREITAHEGPTRPLVDLGLTSRLVAASRARHVLVVGYQEGALAEGSPAELDPDIHRQAGTALRALHAQASRLDEEYEHRAVARAFRWLDGAHRIDPGAAADARAILRSYRPMAIDVVPTHGDWQPRNWLVAGSQLRVIDFGRFDWRPPATDLCRLAAQQWRKVPGLEAALLDGYGSDPRDEHVWKIDQLREAIATAAWAYSVGEEAFEQQGHRMLAEALTQF